jgi:hypothetical protein
VGVWGVMRLGRLPGDTRALFLSGEGPGPLVLSRAGATSGQDRKPVTSLRTRTTASTFRRAWDSLRRAGQRRGAPRPSPTSPAILPNHAFHRHGVPVNRLKRIGQSRRFYRPADYAGNCGNYVFFGSSFLMTLPLSAKRLCAGSEAARIDERGAEGRSPSGWIWSAST